MNPEGKVTLRIRKLLRPLFGKEKNQNVLVNDLLEKHYKGRINKED